ncbi:efflux RND transporter permease subunit [Sphingomonas morindae]|uniref:CusA/CzcA family heavy metal efflux RND transporter n=1 Tax=Sphingomonas morindae TaxID=1541170 RepID=A0ABY4XDB4_9SPHN|nr:CusA/CzcA family heavy metal efflux RND transporter [Sphingomonas morindae]USI74675.1 CusA/CzcA family heavy metal efflux RND transporter [Sphingomonas morindae]
MIERFIRLAITRRKIVLLLAVFIAAYGWYSWRQLSIEAYPDIADVSSQVITQAPGLAAEEVEQQITVPLERALNGTPGLAIMRSKSTFGLSLITLVFRDGSEDYWSRQRIQERITGVTLPTGITPGLDPLTSPIGEIYRYTLESDTLGQRELSELQQWEVIPALSQIQGVAGVNNFGGITTQYQVELDPAQLQRFGLSLKSVDDAITANNHSTGGSVITRGEQGYVVRGVGALHDLTDLGSVVVTQKGGSPVLVRDLGKVRLSQVERHGILGKDDRGDAIEGIVTLLRGENPSRVMDDVHAKVAELNAALARKGARIVPYLDRSDLVHTTVDKVSHTVSEGIGLVLIVLILFLGNARSALIVAIVIPLAMLIAFILMNLTHVPANLLSLGAIDFGIIVDGAIVMMESLLRRREARPDKPLTRTEATDAAVQVGRPIFFATIIIITAYIPLFAFQRIEAKLFTPMAFTVGYALLGALLVSLALVPGLAYVALRKPAKVFHNPLLAWIERTYAVVLRRCLDLPVVIYGIAGAAALAVLLLGAKVGREFLPALDEGSIWLQVQLPSGLSLDKGKEMAGELRRVVRSFPETSYVVTQLGRNDDGTDPFTPSHIEASVGLKPYGTWPAGETKAGLIRRMDARFKAMPGFNVGFSQPMIDGVYDKMAGAHSELVIKIYGHDFHELRRIGTAIVDVLNRTPGAADVAIDQEPPLPQLVVRVDRAAAARLGVNAGDITDLIQTGIGGEGIDQLYVGDRRYDIAVRFPAQVRSTVAEIRNLPITTSSGAQIPLSAVATVSLKSGESTITREMGHRHLTVKLGYRDRDLTSFLHDAQANIAAKVHFNQSIYRLEWGGQFENQARAEKRLGMILAIMFGAMALLLYIQFALVRQVLLILGAVPLATLGGLVALHLTGATLNVASAVGFIALFGVAIQNAIIMVSNLNAHRVDGEGLLEAVLHGAGERLRPVLMTATVATIGMLPAALNTGVGSDVQRGLATVVVGGLIVATALTLFVVPTLYFVIERAVSRRAGRRAPQPEMGA